MRSLALSLLLIGFPAFADSIARDGNDWVRITLKPCADAGVVAVLEQRGLDPLSFRAGVGRFAGEEYALCWQPANGGALLFFADGDTGIVPTADFKRVPEA